MLEGPSGDIQVPLARNLSQLALSFLSQSDYWLLCWKARFRVHGPQTISCLVSPNEEISHQLQMVLGIRLGFSEVTFSAFHEAILLSTKVSW